MKNYIKVPPVKLPLTIDGQRKLSDKVWKDFILSYVMEYYKTVNNLEIKQIIDKENTKVRANTETAIKKHIKRWFRKNEIFLESGIIADIEVGTENNDKEGFYDIKFQHSYWNKAKTYFSFECKNLGKTKSMSLQKSIKEYVYVEKPKKGIVKIDGGMKRHFIGKYAINQNFGGMIGFIVSETDVDVREKVIEKIHKVYDNQESGKLTKEKIKRNTIFGNENTFDSYHLRKNVETQKIEEFTLHHIIMDFFKNIS